MFRMLQVQKSKPVETTKAGEEMVKGALVYKDIANGELKLLTSGLGDFFVDAEKTYLGLDSVVPPTDRGQSTIEDGAYCKAIPTFVGERYATSEATPGYLDKGDPMIVSSGKLIKATSAATYQWIYGGTYEDTATLYVVEKVPAATAPATRTVTYNANGGTTTMVDAHSPYYVGKVATVLESTFVPPTYKDFVDYDTAANGSGTNYDPGDEITIAAANIVLYAQYANSHTLLALNANTGTGTMSDTTKYYVDDVITVPESTFTPPVGKVFSKWNTAAAGTGTDYDPADEITVIADMIGAATTLYAIWVDEG